MFIRFSSRNDSLSHLDPSLSPASTLSPLNSPWDLSTPTSGRGSMSPMGTDDMPFGTPYPSSDDIQDDFFPITDGNNDGIPVFADQNLLFPCGDGKTLHQGIMGYNPLTGYDESTYDTFDVQNSIQNAQTGLDLDMYSQMSGLGSPSPSMSFVVPSQTSFADGYDMNANLCELKSLPVRSSGQNNAQESGMNAPGVNDKFRMMQSQTPRSSPALCLRPSTTRKPAFESIQSSLPDGHAENYGMRRLRKQVTRRSSSPLPTVPSHVRVQNKAIKKCVWPGCNGRFQRQEHLKRHEKTHVQTDSFVCRFCHKGFGRSDNLKSHTKLHFKRTPRTEYFPEAIEVWKEMSRKPRKVRNNTIRCKL